MHPFLFPPFSPVTILRVASKFGAGRCDIGVSDVWFAYEDLCPEGGDFSVSTCSTVKYLRGLCVFAALDSVMDLYVVGQENVDRDFQMTSTRYSETNI